MSTQEGGASQDGYNIVNSYYYCCFYRYYDY